MLAQQGYDTTFIYGGEAHFDNMKRFFSLVFTSTNHSPFEFPDGRIELAEQPKNTVANAVKYADFALGQLIEKAKKSDCWQDTVFLIIADHSDRVYGNELVLFAEIVN